MLSARACLTGGHTRGAGRRSGEWEGGRRRARGWRWKGGCSPFTTLFCCTSTTFHCKPTLCITLLNIQITWLDDRQRACLRWCRSAPRRWILFVFCLWVTTSASLCFLPSCPFNFRKHDLYHPFRDASQWQVCWTERRGICTPWLLWLIMEDPRRTPLWYVIFSFVCVPGLCSFCVLVHNLALHCVSCLFCYRKLKGIPLLFIASLIGSAEGKTRSSFQLTLYKAPQNPHSKRVTFLSRFSVFLKSRNR